jgi:DNA-directed RNA polymerase subunit RPC12/RpoP
MYDCEICKKQFSSKQRLITHQERKIKCEYLDMKEKKIEDAPKHVQTAPKMCKIVETTNMNDEKYKCSYCNRNFSRNYTLIRHMENNCNNKNDNKILENILDRFKVLEDKLSTKSNIIHNTTNNSNTVHITNNIVNFGDLNYDIDKDFIYSCLKGGINGDIDYLRKVYLEDIPRECRSIKCLDPSRDKCVVRKNGEWIATTGTDIYRQSLKKLADHYLRVNNCMLDSNCYYTEDSNTDLHIDFYDENNEDSDNDTKDIEEYINTYSESDNIQSSNNAKIDEYMNNLNRITRMMENKNVERVSKHMNILLK